MGNVVFDISMSVDSFITAAHVRPEEPMGDGGQRLHEWAFRSEGDHNRERLAQGVSGLGVVIAGRRTYDTSVPWWGADGSTGPARRAVFVISHSVPEDMPEGGVYTFVDEIEVALARESGKRRERTDAWSTTLKGRYVVTRAKARDLEALTEIYERIILGSIPISISASAIPTWPKPLPLACSCACLKGAAVTKIRAGRSVPGCTGLPMTAP
jgi:dihydrofolate reductase